MSPSSGLGTERLKFIQKYEMIEQKLPTHGHWSEKSLLGIFGNP
jgi:hypothetical protein